MDNYFTYKRISTKEERGKQKYNRQEQALTRYAKENGIEYLAEFQEDESGKSFTHRKEWGKLERLVSAGDTIIFKDISRFTREAENGYRKYMELMEKGVELIFIDNPTISTPYIRQLLQVAKEQSLVAKVSLESTVKLLLIVELDRAEQERIILINRVKQGISASEKKQGRKTGTVDKLTDEMRKDIQEYLTDRTVKQVDIMRKHGISRNTLKKYAEMVKGEQ
ncbi:MAG: recombinase family protein [Bacteroidales bacterium]|nr:recombinase family protein [Bacteroidales bacterium]